MTRKSAKEPKEQARRDLAAMIVPLSRTLIAQERPILEAHGLTMWGYVVLDALADQPTRSQAALAEAVHTDKTRLIPVLDELQDQGLIERAPDPADRRVHILGLTPAGRKLRVKVQKLIQANERRLLNRLDEVTRAAFLEALATLSTDPEAAFAIDEPTEPAGSHDR